MSVTMQSRSRFRRRFRRLPSCLGIESLEARCLPSITGWPGLLGPLLETESNSTLDLAHDLGNLSLLGRGEAAGTIGNEDDAADVDWYTFSLDSPAQVTLTTLNEDGGSAQESVLSLYNRDDFNFADPYNPLFHRLLAQDDAGEDGNEAQIDRPLAAGTYFLAVSGSGNSHFHPFLAGSGSEGSTGDYGLLLTATDLGLDPADGPAVLASEPAVDAVLASSSFLLRVNLSEPLDPGSLVPDQTVQLFFHANGTFGDGNEVPVALMGVNLSTAGDELQIQPATALQPGHYQLVLTGDSSAWPMVVTDLDGTPLGQNAGNPTGQDQAIMFQIGGYEDGSVADDVADAAHDLGTLADEAFVRRAGAIGDDPAYDLASPDALLANPAADVDLYRFQITSPGPRALIAEVFAGRIGSPLDPALTLFRVNPNDGSLELVQVNDSTLNESAASDGTVPLYTDAVLYAGLTEGEYVLAVSGTSNLPDPLAGVDPGTNGVFDPAVSHSGMNGFTTGPYLLNVRLHADDTDPEVVTVSLAEGEVLTGPPTQFVVEFSEPVNLQQLGYQAFQQAGQAEIASVYVLGSDGVQYHPRLVSYDVATNQAVLLMLDALPNGASELHLSGPLGLTDLGGNVLASNDPTGDHVVRFTVDGPERGTAGNPLVWTTQEPNDTFAQAQVLGVLFPHELETAVRIRRDFTGDPASAPADTADFFQFEVLQSRSYFFQLTGTGLPTGSRPTLFTADGTGVPLLSLAGGAVHLGDLTPGVYVVRVGGWTTAQAANVVHQLRISLGASGENPTPLTVGPAPAYRIRLVNNVPLPPPPPPVENEDPPPPPPEVTPPPPANETPPPPTNETPPPPPPTSEPTPTPPPVEILPPPAPVPVSPPVPPVETPPPAPVAEAPVAPPPTSAPPAETSAPPVAITPSTPALVVATPVLRLELALPTAPLPPTAPAPTTPTGGEVTVGTGVTSDVLASLRGGPVGGVQGTQPSDGLPAGEVLAFRPPQSAPMNLLAQVVVLTQAPSDLQTSARQTSSEQESPPSTPALTQQPATGSPPTPGAGANEPWQGLGPLWGAAVEFLFQNGMQSPQSESGAPPSVTPSGQPGVGETPPVEPEQDQSSGEAQAAADGLDPQWAWLGLGLGLVLPAAADRKKRPNEPTGAGAINEGTTA